MPRRNNHNTKPHNHEPSIYDFGFKKKCYGCAFAGQEFKCMTEDSKCLKTKPDKTRADNASK